MPDNRTLFRTVEFVWGRDDSPDAFDYAETFHEASKLNEGWGVDAPGGAALLQTHADFDQTTRTRNTVRHARWPRHTLPSPALPDVSLATVLTNRRSVRSFARLPLEIEDLSTVLHAAYGIVRPGGGRGVPSGGGLYPLEIYVIATDVKSLEPGPYHYDPLAHELEQLPKSEDFGEAFIDANVYPDIATNAPAMLAITAAFWRSRFKYGLRGYRFCLIEAGHLMQNVLCTAAGLDLGAVPLGGFRDNRVESLLHVDGVNESLIYLAAIGHP